MKGIKCTSNEVNAILSGDKSQIRLVINISQIQPINDSYMGTDSKGGHMFGGNYYQKPYETIFCPHQTGDLVFVKEDFCEKVDQETFEFLGDYHYRASCDFDVFMMGEDGFSIENKDGSERLAWKPAQHMNQHQSRITLRIKDISVERLQDISYEDAIAEELDDDRSFADLWNSTHKKPEEKWKANPFVWVINFEVVK